MNKPPNFQELASKFKRIYDKLPAVAGAIAVRRSKANFQKQGWTPDTQTLPWQERSKKDKSKRRRAILIQTGALRRSVRITGKGASWVRIGSTLPYSKIHNEGGTITSTVNVPQHKRKAHTRKARGGKQKVKEATVSSHTRKMNTRIPQRKFLGPNSGTMKEINEHLKKEIDKAVKQWA